MRRVLKQNHHEPEFRLWRRPNFLKAGCPVWFNVFKLLLPWKEVVCVLLISCRHAKTLSAQNFLFSPLVISQPRASLLPPLSFLLPFCAALLSVFCLCSRQRFLFSVTGQMQTYDVQIQSSCLTRRVLGYLRSIKRGSFNVARSITCGKHKLIKV